jgi:hypothetical protein
MPQDMHEGVQLDGGAGLSIGSAARESPQFHTAKILVAAAVGSQGPLVIGKGFMKSKWLENAMKINKELFTIFQRCSPRTISAVRAPCRLRSRPYLSFAG